MNPSAINIKVCGNEIITAKDTITISLSRPKTGEISYDVSTFFGNSDPKCPIETYSILSEAGVALSNPSLKLNDLKLTIDTSKSVKINFSVGATSSGGSLAVQKFQVEIEEVVVDDTKPIFVVKNIIPGSKDDKDNSDKSPFGNKKDDISPLDNQKDKDSKGPTSDDNNTQDSDQSTLDGNEDSSTNEIEEGT